MANINEYLKSGWLLILIAVAFVLGFGIQSSTTENIKGQIKAVENEIAAELLELESSQTRVDSYNQIKMEFVPRLATVFPENDPQKLIEYLKKKARYYNIEFSDLQIDIPKFMEARKSPDVVTLMLFQMKFKGSYRSLGNFIEYLEQAPYLQNISEMSLAIDDPGGAGLLLNLKGAFRVFDQNVIDWSMGNES